MLTVRQGPDDVRRRARRECALSSLHSKVEFGSLDENVYGLAIDVIDVSGATVSTVNVRVAGD